MPAKYTKMDYQQQLRKLTDSELSDIESVDVEWLWRNRGRETLKNVCCSGVTSWPAVEARMRELRALSKGVTLHRCILTYGEKMGQQRWDVYCQKQAKSNAFEYKQNKHGWTREQFSDYNKSRAVTRERCIQRHGEVVGREIFDRYCQRQAFTNTEAYLGERYTHVNQAKAHTISSYLKRYGDVEAAKKKLEHFWCKRDGRQRGRWYSKISQEFCEKMVRLDGFRDKMVYFQTRNHEYVLVTPERVYKYDFVCPAVRLCIEFHGDVYHANPAKFAPDDIVPIVRKPARVIWKQDEQKQLALKEMRGYDTIVVWESDYRNDGDLVCQRVEAWISARRPQMSSV